MPLFAAYMYTNLSSPPLQLPASPQSMTFCTDSRADGQTPCTAAAAGGVRHSIEGLVSAHLAVMKACRAAGRQAQISWPYHKEATCLVTGSLPVATSATFATHLACNVDTVSQGTGARKRPAATTAEQQPETAGCCEPLTPFVQLHLSQQRR
jgi:hypothetical protein